MARHSGGFWDPETNAGDFIAAFGDTDAFVAVSYTHLDVYKRQQQNLVLERFADYWGEGAKVDKVTYQIYENACLLYTSRCV